MLNITATEAQRHFSDVLNRVQYQGVDFAIQRGNRTIAHITPATPQSLNFSDFIALLNRLPELSSEDRADFAETINDIRSKMHLPENPWAS